MSMTGYPWAAFAVGLVASASAWGQSHPVLVEGNCDAPVFGTTLVAPGTCGDFDGDGRIAGAEDGDGADRIFGTIGAALGPGEDAALNTGINQNGQITIVTSGRFYEQLVITAANGNVTRQAAPGVEATIDAIADGATDQVNAARQALSGVVLGTPGDTHRIILRNVTIRNWAIGIDVAFGNVSLIDVRLANNVHFGVRVRNTSVVSIDRSEVIATGFRAGINTAVSPSPATPQPGAGIAFQNSSFGAVYRTNISGNFGPGVQDASAGVVVLTDDYFFNNNPNTVGIP